MSREKGNYGYLTSKKRKPRDRSGASAKSPKFGYFGEWTILPTTGGGTVWRPSSPKQVKRDCKTLMENRVAEIIAALTPTDKSLIQRLFLKR